MAAPDLGAHELTTEAGGLPWLVREVLGSRLGKLFLCDVVFAIMVCTLAVQCGAARLLFSMSRDGCLPWSSLFARVSPRFKTPLLATVVSGAGAIAILTVNSGFPRIFELVTSVAMLWANLAYLFVVGALLKRRLEGWPQGMSGEEQGLFRLGRAGIAISFLAVSWCLFTVVNIAWPRVEVYGGEPWHRFGALGMTLGLMGACACLSLRSLTARQLSTNPSAV
jgi:amino acid transporter